MKRRFCSRFDKAMLDIMHKICILSRMIERQAVSTDPIGFDSANRRLLEATSLDLPLDLEHYPADLAEAVEMLRRAKREVSKLRDLLGWCLLHDGECLGDWPAKREQVVCALKGKP